MIYLFQGSDVEHVRRKAFAWVAAAQKKEPNLAYTRFAREELFPAVLEDITYSGGLFVKRLLIVLDDPFPPTRTKDENEEDTGEEPKNAYIDDHIDALAASDNAILIIAPKLLATKAKKIGAKAKAVYTFDKPREVKRGFNAPLPDALGVRSREKLWLELQKAMRAGDAPEMLHGLLHWKAREILEKGSRSWKPQEAHKLSLALIELLQSSRRGGLPLATALERFALSI